jgi:plastocyanin
MKRHLFLALAAMLALAVSASVAFGRSAAAKPTLNGTVGPGFSITLTQKGKKVKTLKAGKYVFKISDKASIHNFVLEKEHSKFEKELTDVSDTGTKTATISLTKGTYKYYCEPHESSMNGTFKVT